MGKKYISRLLCRDNHLWKVDNDGEEEGGQNEGCRVQSARVSDVSEFFYISFNIHFIFYSSDMGKAPEYRMFLKHF